jgi:hypothetical protein
MIEISRGGALTPKLVSELCLAERAQGLFVGGEHRG